MANEFYRGQKRKEQIGASVQSVRGPDMSEQLRGSQRRTQAILNGIDGLKSVAAAGERLVGKISDSKVQEAKDRGASTATAGGPRPEDNDFWTGDAAQKAYDDVASETAVQDLPRYIEQHMANNANIKKPFNELTSEERLGYMQEAKTAYMKERKLSEKPYAGRIDMYANEMMGKQNQIYNKQQRAAKESEAENNISQLVMKRTNAFGGNAQEIDDTLGLEMTKYQQSLGDPSGIRTKEAIVTGLVQSVMSDDPNLKALAYLKSEQAQKRFGDVQGYTKAVKQATDFSQKAQNAAIAKQKAGHENEFYGLLNAGQFTNQDEVQEALDMYPDNVIDQEQKFNMMNRAMRFIKQNQAADSLQDAIGQKNFGVVNSAKQEDLTVSFERNVMSKSQDLDTILNYQGGPNDPETTAQTAFTKWVMDGFNVPNYVKDHLNSPINAGNTAVWDKRLATYNRLSQRLGATGLSKLYTSETQASLDEYAALTADTVMKPEDKKQALTNFLEGAKEDRITGLSVNHSIRKEILDEDKGFLKEMQSFLAEGGGDTTLDMSVPPDLQPFTTTRSNSDTGINGYAMKSLMGNYSVYRRQNPNAEPEVALRKAKNDFLSQNLWVDWAEKATYVPREFGANFATEGMRYIKDSGIIQRLAVTEGLPEEDIEKKVTIEPASDYHQSRKMSIFYDGIEQNEKFTLQQFDKKVSLLSAQERAKIEKENADLRNSPEYKARQERIMRFQKSMRTFGFGMN